jgi:DNA-directed RNA polymerase specialized sigma24 family protein
MFIDWRAVEWVVTERIRMPLKAPERREVVRRLVGKLTADELSQLLRVTKRTIERDKGSIRSRVLGAS